MIQTQPQLFPIALNPGDVVYTPDDVAQDVVNFFKPSGRILEPSCGDGAFLKYLPGADWCEIEKGRDFFACHNRYDWIIGNPPYSIFSDFMRHAFEISDNIVFVIPINKAYNSDRMLREICEYGGMPSIYVIGAGGQLGFVEVGFAIGAVHFQRGYKGGTFITFRDSAK